MNRIKTYLKQCFCSHVFSPKDFVTKRDGEGNVSWKCSKYNKNFTAEYGLKILEKGKCDGKWGAIY